MTCLTKSQILPNGELRSLKNCSCASSPAKIFKCCCFVIAGVLILEFIIFNILALYGYVMIRDNISPVLSKNSNSWIEKLSENKFFRDTIYAGKAGTFVSLLQETLERVYIRIPEKGSNDFRIGTLGVDVSHSGEALYLYRRMARRRKSGYKHLVIDIGANDGFLSSNSFNFIRWGWDAILVEPQTAQLQMAMRNVRRYNNPYNGNQSVRFVKAILGDTNGLVSFVMTNDVVSMESHVVQKKDQSNRNLKKSLTKVQSITVKTFVTKYQIPRFFDILSIDAEGTGNKILHDFIDLGYRLAFIIYEDLHERHWEAPVKTMQYLSRSGYRFLSKRGWNNILEHGTNMND